MKPPISFFVSGHPKGQPRARATRRGNHAGVYDPGTADAWKSCVRSDWKAQPQEPWTGPIYVRLTFFFPRPNGHFRTGKNASILRDNAPNWHAAKPDADNAAKAVLDALTNAGAWADDAQVARLVVEKRWGLPGCRIEISELENNFIPETK